LTGVDLAALATSRQGRIEAMKRRVNVSCYWRNCLASVRYSCL